MRDNKMKCLIIHLERAHQRRQHLEKLLSSGRLDSSLIIATDANAILPEEYASYYPNLCKPTYHSKLKITEVACFLSHRRSWQYIVDNNLEYALVVEDDVEIAWDTFEPALLLASSNAQQGDVVRFPIKKKEKSKTIIAESADFCLFEPAEIKLGMMAQLVTHGAAKRLLDSSGKFDRPVDCFLQMRWLHKARVLSVWPSGVTEVSSQLGGSLLDHKVNGLEKIRREILRPIYRYKISQISRTR